MTKSEKIFFERAKKNLDELICWCASPNLTETINSCIDVLVNAKVAIELKESEKESEEEIYIYSSEENF